MDDLPYIDTLFKEYLLFRGFTSTLQTLQAEVDADRGCGFQADQLSELIFRRIIPSHSFSELVELLKLLSSRLYSHLDASLESASRRLEVGRWVLPVALLGHSGGEWRYCCQGYICLPFLSIRMGGSEIAVIFRI